MSDDSHSHSYRIIIFQSNSEVYLQFSLLFWFLCYSFSLFEPKHQQRQHNHKKCANFASVYQLDWRVRPINEKVPFTLICFFLFYTPWNCIWFECVVLYFLQLIEDYEWMNLLVHNFQLNENYEQPNKRTGKSNNKNWIDSLIICVRLFVIQFRICCDFRNACACPSNYCRKLINVRWDRIFLSNELNRVRCQFNPLQLQSKTQCKRIRTVHAQVSSWE